MNQQLSMFSLEELPANHSQLQDSEKDWTIRVATSCLSILPLLQSISPSGWFGRTSPESCHLGGGQDFGTFLGALGELGYGFAYRVLDAQYFGVAQRRRRVFVVGCLGDWRSAAAVLFERHSLSGNPAPSREKGQEVAATIAARFGISRNNHEKCVAWPTEIAPTLDAHYGDKMGLENQHINSGGGLYTLGRKMSDNENKA